MVNYISYSMEQLTYDSKKRMASYEDKLNEAGIEILKKAILTSGITLYIIRHPGDESIAAWGFYPKTGIEDYLASRDSSEGLNVFYHACIDKLLDKHNWFNPDVAQVIERRKEFIKA